MSNDQLPEGMEDPLQREEESLEYRCDVVVVGLGAGGAMVLHELAQAGVDVLGIEMGGHFGPREMSLREEEMLPRLFCEGAARATSDMAISVMQGKGVGGSTIHNTSLCKRLPEQILENWRTHGVEGLDQSLTDDFEAVEEMLNVHRIPDDRVNANNDVLLRGARALGYASGKLAYNRDLCRGSGFCEVGCPNDGKENATRALALPALAEGARILIHTRAQAITHRGSTVTGVKAQSIDDRRGLRGPKIRVHADRVVLAASATGSAALAQQSDLPDPNRLIGSRLHLHPGAFVMGIFDEPIQGWIGVPQSAECTEFLDHRPGADHRAWLVTGFAHPGAAAGLMPGFGREHGQMMGHYPHVAGIIVMLHDEASGTVRPGDGERITIHYRLDHREYMQVALGLREAAKILFAAGARQVVVPTSPARILNNSSRVAAITADELGPFNPSMVAVHPMSTMWMGADPSTSVVNSYGAHHHTRGLYVADGSLFPSSIGGPPQIPIYALGRRVARAILDDLPAGTG